MNIVVGALYVFFGISLFLSSRKKAVLERIFRKTGYRDVKDKTHRSRGFYRWLKKNYLEVDPAGFSIIYAVSSGFIFSLMLTFGLNIFISLATLSILSSFLFLLIIVRKRRINTAKREQLEILLNTLMGNLYSNPNLLTGLQVSVKSVDYPLRSDIEKIIERTRSGALLNDAIKRFIKESDDPVIERVFLGFIASNDKGFELIEFIRKQLDHLRQSHSMERYIEVLSTGPRYTSYLIMVIPVVAVVIVCIINRDFTQVLFSRSGFIILIYSVLSYIVGFYLIGKLINSIRKRGI